MAGIESKRFEDADDVRTPEKTRIEMVHIGDGEVGRFTFQPGWVWSECIQPVAGTDMCESEHLGYVTAGVLHVEHEDGTTRDIQPGEAYRITARHNAWVVGDVSVVTLEFKGAETYART